MKSFGIAAFFLSFSLWASTPQYLLLSHDPDFLKKQSAYTKTVSHNGRTFLVTLKKSLKEIPEDVRKNLREVHENEILSEDASFSFEKEAINPSVKKIVDQVSSIEIEAKIKLYSELEKRSTAELDKKKDSGNKKAMALLEVDLKNLGLSTSTHCYTKRRFDDECNVIGEKKGLSPNAKDIVVIAHLDTVGYDKAGADDNASGLAGLLEMARLTKNLNFENNIVFVAVNGEETGLNGSTAYVSKLKKEGRLQNVLHALVMDMISYNSDGVVDLETNTEYLDFVNWIATQAKLYTNLKPHIATPAWGSDHEPFLNEGVSSFLLIENWKTKTPCYHKACDTLKGLNMNYAAELVKLNTAILLEKALLKD